MDPNQWLQETLDELIERSVRHDVPLAIAEYAGRATSRTFAGAPRTVPAMRRVRSYYAAVVRRRLVRSRDGSRAVARVLAATVVAELSDSGRDRAAVWSELEHGWRDTIPTDVLEEYRELLCA